MIGGMIYKGTLATKLITPLLIVFAINFLLLCKLFIFGRKRKTSNNTMRIFGRSSDGKLGYNGILISGTLTLIFTFYILFSLKIKGSSEGIILDIKNLPIPYFWTLGSFVILEIMFWISSMLNLSYYDPISKDTKKSKSRIFITKLFIIIFVMLPTIIPLALKLKTFAFSKPLNTALEEINPEVKWIAKVNSHQDRQNVLIHIWDRKNGVLVFYKSIDIDAKTNQITHQTGVSREEAKIITIQKDDNILSDIDVYLYTKFKPNSGEGINDFYDYGVTDKEGKVSIAFNPKAASNLLLIKDSQEQFYFYNYSSEEDVKITEKHIVKGSNFKDAFYYYSKNEKSN